MTPDRSPLPAHLENVALILCRTQGPVNMGMVARLCGNFGITDLRFVAPMFEVDCDEARKFSVHAKEQMLAAPVFATLEEAVADCGLVVGTTARVRDADLGVPVLPRQLPSVLARRPAARWALVFGNEADGLHDHELRCCQAFVRLEHFGGIYSYNLSHAVAIMLYELACLDARPADPDQPPGADRDQVERLFHFWLHTLERFDYFRRTKAERFAPQLRQLFTRLHLSDMDVQMFWGMLAQFHYKAFGDRAKGMHDPEDPQGPRS